MKGTKVTENGLMKVIIKINTNPKIIGNIEKIMVLDLQKRVENREIITHKIIEEILTNLISIWIRNIQEIETIILLTETDIGITTIIMVEIIIGEGRQTDSV